MKDANRAAMKANAAKTKGKSRSKPIKNGSERPLSIKLNAADERCSSMEYIPLSETVGTPKKKIFLLENEQNLMKKEIEDLRVSLNSVNKVSPPMKNIPSCNPTASSPINNSNNNAKEIFWEVSLHLQIAQFLFQKHK